MEAVFELAVHLDCLRNIDLFRQGLYHVRVRLFTQNWNSYNETWIKENLAFPYHVIEDPTIDTKVARMVRNMYYDSTIDTRHQYFRSSTYRVQYCDQKLPLNNCCIFRLPYSVLEPSKVFIELELMFAEYKTSDAINHKPIPDIDAFAVVSSKLYEVPISFDNGIHICEPITFQDTQYCLVNTMIHGAIIEYKLKQPKKNDTTTTTTEEKEGEKKINSSFMSRERILISSLFKDKEEEMKTHDIIELCDKYHNFLVGILLNTYATLAEFYRLAYIISEDSIRRYKPHTDLSISLLLSSEIIASKSVGDILEFQVELNEKFTVPPLTRLSTRIPIADIIKTEEVSTNSRNSTTVNNDDNDNDNDTKLINQNKTDDNNNKDNNQQTKNDILKEQLCSVILSDCMEIAPQIFQLWHDFLQILPLCPKPLYEAMHAKFMAAKLEQWSNYVFRESHLAQERFKKAQEDTYTVHENICSVVRNQAYIQDSILLREVTESYPNENCSLFFEETWDNEPKYKKRIRRNSDANEIFFNDAIVQDNKTKENNHINNNDNTLQEEEVIFEQAKRQVIRSKEPYLHGPHYFIFVHGYQANSYDMRLFKNRVLLLFPDSKCLLSVSNEGRTEGDISDMGERLAQEVVSFLQDERVGKLSFVCHSLGGLIARAALTHSCMDPYLPHLYNYVSLAVPHCGYLYGENTMLSTGIWFLKKWNKSVCLGQLTLTDDDEIENTYLFKLSKEKGLEYFEHVFLLASGDDKYAPFHSARIEHVPEWKNEDSEQGKAYTNMVNNILNPFTFVVLKRMDIIFGDIKRSIDSFIGRTAHICFLDQTEYMAFFLCVYKSYFE